MAMIKCPDCKTSISDSAACCPRCGCNFRPEYEQMQRLRKRIYEMEHDTSARPAEPGGGIGGCAIVALIMTIAAVVVVIYGIVLLTGMDGGSFWGLVLIIAGGYAAFQLFGLTVLSAESNSSRNADRKREIKKYDERPAELAEAKRQLAQLETKLR